MGEAKVRRDNQVREAMDVTARAISVIHRTALGVAGLIGDQDAKEVPRLCIAAGLRTVELMLEQYRGIKAAEPDTRLSWADYSPPDMERAETEFEEMLARRRQQILEALKDAEAAMAEGHQAIIALGEAIVGAKVTLQ